MTRFYRDNGQGGVMTLIAMWIASVDLKTSMFKARSTDDLQMLGNVYWSIFLRPDLALLNTSTSPERDRIKTKYVN
jgi:hypothetical protein